MNWYQGIALLTTLSIAVSATALPVRRSPGELEARRRSAIDRNVVRFGRSYPAAVTAAEIREAFQRPARRQNSFLRFGRSQPITMTTDELVALIKAINDEDYDGPVSKRGMDFLRLGRDPKFIRFGRSAEDEKTNGYETPSDLYVHSNQQRKARARDHFLRLGRDSEELSDGQNEIDDQDIMEDSRKKRSTESVCHDCQS